MDFFFLTDFKSLKRKGLFTVPTLDVCVTPSLRRQSVGSGYCVMHVATVCVLCILHSRVEWFSFFYQFLKTFTFLLIRSAILAARQSFHFQKITGTLKINIFLKTVRHLPNTSKMYRKFEKKLFNFIFIFQKWSKLFLIYTRSQYIFFFSLHFLL